MNKKKKLSCAESEKSTASGKKESKKKKKNPEKKVAEKDKSPIAKKELLPEKNSVSKSPKSKPVHSGKTKSSSGKNFS